jgi:hypothetical protein
MANDSTTSSTVAYLPKSKRQSYAPPVRGTWTPSQARDLPKIADDFVAPSGAASPHSIPDVWKRPLVFADALCRAAQLCKAAQNVADAQNVDDKLPPLEKTIRAEWRGALAILAFWGIRGWDWLQAETVELVGAQAREQKLSFMKVLHKLQPDQAAELLVSDITWQRFHVLRGPTGDPFALTSPMSLVCTAEDYTGRVEGVPWVYTDPKSERIRLVDPLDGDHLSLRERRWLAQWLAYLGSSVSRLPRPAGRMQDIVTLLNAYEVSANDGARAVPFTMANLRRSGLALFDPQNLRSGDPLYQLLDKPIGSSGNDSDVEVEQVRSTDHYYLIEPALAHQWGRGPREIVIYGARTLADGIPDPRSPSGLIQQTDNCYWCTKDFFLEKRIIVFTEPNCLPGCHHTLTARNAGRRTAIPPLREEVLRLIPADKLTEMLSIEWVGDSIIARLRLNLRQSNVANPEGEMRECFIEQTYRGEAIQEVDGSDVPVAKIWPNFTATNWNVYYTYIALTGREFQVRPFRYQQEPEERDYTDQGLGFAVFRMSGFPEALIFSLPVDSQTPQRQERVRAVLPLQPPNRLEQVQSALGSIAIGVDFGSTGSILFRKSTAGDPSEFTIQPRLYSVTKESVANALRTDREFLPNEARLSNDILSVFQVHGDPPGGDPARLPLCDGHILYLKTPEKFIDENTRNVKTNLKWGGQHETYLSGSFLQQLCLQAAAEALAAGATQLQWRFSYPTAFDRTKVEYFGKIWSDIAQKVQTLTGVASSLADQGPNQDFCEAVCTARYFKANGKMNTSHGALSVDIGGGTSDYAFWKDDLLTVHNSILLAGRDIFLAALRENPKFLATLDRSFITAVADIERLRQIDRNAAHAQIDAIIARKGDNLQLALAMAHEEEAVKGFCRLVEIGITGILYYGGLLLRHQVEDKGFVPKDVFGIYAGGNGSKLFHWAFGHTFTGESAPAVRLGGVFRKACGFADDVAIVIRLSEKPKSEVAYGLVASVPRDRSLQLAGETAGLLACESFQGGPVGQPVRYTWKQSPPIGELRAHGIRIDPEMPEFTRYLTAIGYSLDKVQRADLVASVNNRLASLFSEASQAKTDQDAEKSLPRGEPVWVIAFKAFLEDQIDAWARSV